jgi:hypothetical protein
MKSASIQSGEVTWGNLTNSLFTRSNIRVLEFLVAQSHHVVAGPDMTHSMFDTCLGGADWCHTPPYLPRRRRFIIWEREKHHASSYILLCCHFSFMFLSISPQI